MTIRPSSLGEECPKSVTEEAATMQINASVNDSINGLVNHGLSTRSGSHDDGIDGKRTRPTDPNNFSQHDPPSVRAHVDRAQLAATLADRLPAESDFSDAIELTRDPITGLTSVSSYHDNGNDNDDAPNTAGRKEGDEPAEDMEQCRMWNATSVAGKDDDE